MKRRFYIISAVVLLGAFLLGLDGLQLADGEAASNGLMGDRMIGAYVTTEYVDLFDIEAYLNANAHKLNGGDIFIEDTTGYEGRLYAELVEKTMTRKDGTELVQQEYQFTELEGMAGYCPTMWHEGGEGEESYGYKASVSTGGMETRIHSKSINGRDELEVEGTLYVSLDAAKDYYVNPVFQDAEGKVYLTSGSGMSVDSDADRAEGELWTVNMESTFTETVDGESVTSKNSVSVKLVLVQPTKHVGVALMDRGHNLLDSLGYAPEAVPEELDVSGAEYIILETYGGENGREVLDRKVYGPEDETAAYYLPRENGVCERMTVALKWD